MNKDYLTAVIICKDAAGRTTGLKYHDIKNNSVKLEIFVRFASRKPGAKYVNFYYKTKNDSEKGKNYAFRRYFAPTV